MRKIILIITLLISFGSLMAQDTLVVDKIVGRIGDEIILQSDIESSYSQWIMSGYPGGRNAKCAIFEDLLIQKLLVNQAKIDSISVTDEDLDMQVKSRMEMFVMQAGGVQELENYLNKSIYEITEDMKKVLKNQIVAEKERNHVIGEVDVTPAEVAEFFKKIPKDSIPLVEESYQIRQILIYPKLTPEQNQITIDKLNDMRDKIVSGQRKFESLARMYSEDEMSAKQGGELGFVSRADLDPDFATAAFSLNTDEISGIVKSVYGYHLIQLIERKGERINVRHILVRQYIPQEAKQIAIDKADSLKNLIESDSLSFSDAAKKFSDDTKTKQNGGLIFNMAEESTKFKLNELSAFMKYEIAGLEEGQISEPVVSMDEYGNTVIKLYYIEKKTPEHTANLKDDYQLIYKLAIADKQEKIFSDWIKKTLKTVYISLDKNYYDCKFKYKWIK